MSFFSFGHCAVLLITVCLFCPFFLCPLCCIADHHLSIFSKKKGQNRKTEINNTAQRPKEKKDKKDKQWSTKKHNGERKKRT
jgi:hypothetical protein